MFKRFETIIDNKEAAIELHNNHIELLSDGRLYKYSLEDIADACREINFEEFKRLFRNSDIAEVILNHHRRVQKDEF